MANSKLTSLTALATIASGDKFYLVDVSDTSEASTGTSKVITFANIVSGVESQATGFAASGANSDITSLTGLTTPLTVAQGGTGAATLTDGGVLLGSGTGAITAMGVLADGSIVIGDGSSDPTTLAAFSSSTGTLKVANGGSGAATLTGILKGNGTSAFTAVTAPSGTIVGTSDTQTMTNKRVTPRVSTETSSATPTINTDNVDMHTITALAVAITSFTTNLSGTPTTGQKLIIRILDDGTARAITWGASFASRGEALPTTTAISKYLYVGLIWNEITSTWDCLMSRTEA